MGRWDYPRSKRIMLQIALCVIFAASVGLAQLVTKHRRTIPQTHLAKARELGRIHPQLPEGWEVKHWGPTSFVAQESDSGDRLGRSISGHIEELRSQIPAMDYLVASDVLNESTHITQRTETIMVGGVQGVLLAVSRRVGEDLQNQWIACSVGPSGSAITLVLDCPENDDREGDQQTLRDIAGSIQLNN